MTHFVLTFFAMLILFFLLEIGRCFKDRCYASIIGAGQCTLLYILLVLSGC